MSKTYHKHALDTEEMKQFIRASSVFRKLACVSQAKPVELTIEEVNILADYFPDLKVLMQNSVS